MSEAKEEFQGKGNAVPLFSMVSNNANGLSAYPKTTPGRRRRAAKMSVIKKFAEDYDAVLLQETKLNALEDNYLNFDGSKTFYSNKDDKHAGLATIIGPKLLRHYTLLLQTAPRVQCLCATVHTASGYETSERDLNAPSRFVGRRRPYRCC